MTRRATRSVIVVALGALFALACETSPRRSSPSAPEHAPEGTPPVMPIPVIETTEVIAPPSVEEMDVEAPEEEDEIAPSGAREIHPHGGMSDCLEMYSACSPDPDRAGTQRCTSAPLLLACGQTGTIPGGDTLVCVCP